MSETNEPELLPCPFCGGTAVLTIDKGFEAWDRYHYVQCGACLIRTDNSYTECVIEEWNSRTHATPQWTTAPPKEEGYYWCMRKSWTKPIPARVFRVHDHDERKRLLHVETERGWMELKEFCEIGFGLMKEPMYWLKLDVPPLPEGKGTAK